MKKITVLLTSLLLLLGFMLAFCSCGPTPSTDCTEHIDANGDGVCDNEGCGEPVDAPDPSPDPSLDCFDENGGLILFRAGVPTFQIVKGNDSTGSNAEINSIVTALNGACTGEVNAVVPASEQMTVEILIGTVSNRGEEYNFDKYSLGEKGYIIKIVGTKIIVQGGSEASLKTAVKYLKETVFGITRSTPPFADFSMSLELNKENYQTKFDVTSIKLMDNDISDYTITYSGNNTAKDVATAFQKALYTAAGKYLPIDRNATSGKKIIFNLLENDGEGLGYEVYLDKDANLIFECEFEYLFEALATNTYEKFITKPSNKKVSLSKGTITSDDVRNLYYEECGAVGDGFTDDFEAIYTAHELANKHGHIVNGKPGATYYINKTGGKTAVIMTDVNWNGCNFIFDDSNIQSHDGDRVKCTQSPCPECAERNASIFTVDSPYSSKDVTSAFKGISLKGGYGEEDNTTVIPNWPLDYLSLVVIYNSNRRIFVRVGVNASNGSTQQEYILVHPDGRIDESTPLTYDYDVVTSAKALNVDEKYLPKITIDGGGGTITNIANNPGDIIKNDYISYARNIDVYRSNVVIKNFHHRVTNDQLYRAPYKGILYVNSCNNVEYRDITLQKHKARHISAVNSPGTYEIGGYGSNDIRYYNVDAINFFCDGASDDFKDYNGNLYEAGEVAYRGIMGTNFIRNFHFEGCTLQSFDAHAGLGNTTIVDCTFEHINIQGSGKVIIKDTIIYADGARCIAKLRADYGSSWQGDLIVENVTMKYSKDYQAGNSKNQLMVLGTNDYGQYKDNDFDTIYNPETGKHEGGDGCYNYLPINVTVTNLKVVRYRMDGFIPATGNGLNSIKETIISEGATVYLYDPSIYGYRTQDISKIKSESNNAVGEQNRIVGSKTITVTQNEECSDTAIKVPDSLNLQHCVYTLNDVLYVWDYNAFDGEDVWVPAEDQ